jgi:hypothetical protein
MIRKQRRVAGSSADSAKLDADSNRAYKIKKPFQHKLERFLHPERPARNHFHAGIHPSIYCFTPSA